MAVNRQMSGYPLFFGEPGEDPDLFLAVFWMALHINRIFTDDERLGMFQVVLRRDADTWFQGLAAQVRTDFPRVVEAFQAQFGQPLNTQKLWRDITLLKQKCLSDYYEYRQEFTRLWTLWLRSLPNPGDRAEFLKKERFIGGLIPPLRIKVEAGEPANYADAERRAIPKGKKNDVHGRGREFKFTKRTLPSNTNTKYKGTSRGNDRCD